MTRGHCARAQAALLVSAVCWHHRSLNAVLPEALAALPDERRRAQVQDLVYGSLRWRPRLAALRRRLLHKPLKRRDNQVGALLEVGLYELLFGAQPDYAVVDECVKAARELGKAWAAPVINAGLRRFLRERETLLGALAGEDEARLAHPAWLLERWRDEWPQDWESMAAAGNAHPPMWLRVNIRQSSVAEYQAQLAAAGLAAAPSPWCASALRLAEAVGVNRLPGFESGRASVQDVSAQLAAGLLAPQAGQRVLDACAAPGGKSAHLLEAAPSIRLVAVDVDARRLARLEQNLGRLGLAAQCLAGDATRPGDWWDGEPFQRILLDAPCTATGVIRRHPDIKCLRRPEDVASLARRQQAMLSAVWPLLAPGGMLLYTTCSVLAEENDGVIGAFAAAHPGLRVRPPEADWGRAQRFGRQILPGEGDGDGFYYAVMHKGP